MIRIVGRAHIPLRLIQHKITRPGLLDEGVPLVGHIVFGGKFESAVFYRFAIDGHPAGADLTPGNSAADAELLGDKFIKSH